MVGVAMLVAVSVLWSFAGVAVKTAGMHPLGFAFYRCLFAALPMAVFAGLGVGRRPAARWMVLSVCVYTAVVTCFVASMSLSTAAAGIFLQYSAPAFCALLSWIFLRRRIGRRTFVALVVASAGIAVMVAFRPATQGVAGPALGLVSGVAFGALPLILAQVDRASSGRANPFLVVLFNNLGAVVILLPLCIATGSLGVQTRQLLIVAATGMFQLALPYVLFQLALRRVNVVDASLLILLEPVLNPLWVVLFVGERPDVATVIGGVAILAAFVVEVTKGQESDGVAE